MRVASRPPNLGVRVALIAGVAATYFAAARLGLGFATLAEQVSPVWPPSGLALAALLVLGYRTWPGVWLGAFGANLLAHEPWWMAAGIAVGNTLESMLGAWLLRRVRFHERLDRVWDVMALVGLAAVAATGLSATIGVLTLCAGGVQPWSGFGALWGLWWVGDAMGVVLVGPALLVCTERRIGRRRLGRLLEAVALGVCVVVAALTSFSGYLTQITGRSFAYHLFPLLIWGALRFAQKGAAVTNLLVAVVAVACTVQGLGPFAADPSYPGLIMLQLFLAALALTSLVLGAAVAERDSAERRRAADYAVAQVLGESATLEDAATRILKGICRSLDWDVGAIWVADAGAGELRCLEAWQEPGLAAPAFLAETRTLRLPPGIGLPGRVWLSGAPAWISDVVEDANFPRAALAGREGLHAAFGFPISARGEVVGIIEFFSREVRLPDAQLLQLFAAVGSRIGQFMDRRRAEAALRESEAELRQTGEAKDQFLALLGHELRNPLAPLRNGLEVLRREGTEGESGERMLAMMERQVAHMVRLVDDLLDVSRITRGKIELRRERVDLKTAVERALEMVRPLFEERGHDLRPSLPREPVELDADPARLEQVLANLLSNAAKYTPAPGTIDLSVVRDGAEAVVRVRDSGIGIQREMLERIFDPFAQADRLPDRAPEGLGMGLTLVRKLVEMHGGTVTAASEGMGRGSEFVVRLPCLPPRPAAPPAIAAPPPAAVAPPRRVLVVDDNVDSAESLAMLLQLGGHAVWMAHDGPSALVAAREHHPELVLLDIGLPAGMDGYEVARRMRPEAGLQRAVIVALTGYGQDEDRRRAAAAGFDHHLVKPVDAQDLLRLIRSL